MGAEDELVKLIGAILPFPVADMPENGSQSYINKIRMKTDFP
jgi:hypothetical protein